MKGTISKTKRKRLELLSTLYAKPDLFILVNHFHTSSLRIRIAGHNEVYTYVYVNAFGKAKAVICYAEEGNSFSEYKSLMSREDLENLEKFEGDDWTRYLGQEKGTNRPEEGYFDEAVKKYLTRAR